MKLTEEEIETLVSIWKERLGLSEWRIKTTFDEGADDDCFAETQPSKHYDVAEIAFHKAKLASLSSKREIEETVVHELIHCAHRDVEAIVDLFDGQLHRDVETVLTESFRHDVEAFIDRMARYFVGLAPVTKFEDDAA